MSKDEVRDRRLSWLASIALGASPPYITVHTGRLEALAFAEHEWRGVCSVPLAWTVVPTSPDMTMAEPPGAVVMVYPAMVHGGLLLSSEDAGLLISTAGAVSPPPSFFELRKALLAAAQLGPGGTAWRPKVWLETEP